MAGFVLSVVAGVECATDAWSNLGSVGPVHRQDHSMVCDASTQSMLVFGGQASGTFRYFDELWRYSWPLNSWAQIFASGPGPRFGHSAVWDPHSRSMLVLGGKHLSEANAELWAFASDLQTWERLSPASRARAYHSATFDDSRRAMLVFGGEDTEVLGDLHIYNVVENHWLASTASGPGPRTRHSALWDSITGSMLMLGGWNGFQYLAELWRYDAWAKSWSEVLVAGPWPRAGHGAAWDPVSLSLLVFGGVQNVSGNLSYDHRLYSYSLLAGWTELQLNPQLPRPSGRSDMAMAWDARSRILLVSGGFDGSYLEETWRYIASDTLATATPIVRCQLGQPCLLNLSRNSSEQLMVKRRCSDLDAIEGVSHPLAQSAADADAPFLWVAEPGAYHMCQCGPSQPCNHPAEFAEAVGIFIAEGPFSNQSAECFMGSPCRINSWIGVGISTDDSLVLRSSCSSPDTSAYSEAAVLVQFNQSIDSFSLDLGRLATGKTEVVELCWCPASGLGADVLDFVVVALRLHIQCPPGQYESETLCLPCPGNQYCPGGRAMLSCPTGSTALVGSSPLLSGTRWKHVETL